MYGLAQPLAMGPTGLTAVVTDIIGSAKSATTAMTTTSFEF